MDVSSCRNRCLRYIEQRLCVQQAVEGLVRRQQDILLSSERSLILSFLLQLVRCDEIARMTEVGDELRERASSASVGVETRICESAGADAASVLCLFRSDSRENLR